MYKNLKIRQDEFGRQIDEGFEENDNVGDENGTS